MTGPDAAKARARYDRMAAAYDRQLGPVRRLQESFRKRAVDGLSLQAGATVLDVGCGTGASFARLVRAVGPGGVVVGVDQSAGMLDVARQRISNEGWANVRLIEASMQSADLPSADAALFFFTHDLMRTPTALDNVVRAVQPGGRVTTAGARRPPWWLAPVAVPAWLAMRRYVTTTDGVRCPWDLLATRLSELDVELRALGAVYVVSGVVPST